MNDIIRKQMKDIEAPASKTRMVPLGNDANRPVAKAPDTQSFSSGEERDDRIGKNPFFEKARTAPREIQKAKNSNGKGLLMAVLFALFLAGGFVVLNYFATATVKITPITRHIVLDDEFIAVKDAKDEGDLVFQFMSIVDEKMKEVPATIEKKLQIKASGKVRIYNEYSKDSQRLIKNTRLEDTKTKKIYRINESVVVPGMKIVDGKSEPGSVDVIVYADVEGDGYNIADNISNLATFTIPGFKGDPRYTKFKAMSIPGFPISGGFSGTIKVPSDESISQSREEIKQDLKKEAVEKARAQIPPNVTFFPGSIIIKFEELPQDFSADNAGNVSVRATVSVFFFDTDQLIKKISSVSLREEKNNSFIMPDISNVTFSFVDPVNNVVLSDLAKIHFRLVGNTDFVGSVDIQAISSSFAGKNKKDFSKIIINQDNIAKADAVIRPVWKTVFPVDAGKIIVNIDGTEDF